MLCFNTLLLGCSGACALQTPWPGWGGDEFAIIYAAVDRLADPQMLAKRIIDCIAAPFRIAETEVAIGTTIGIALADQGLSSEQIVDRADRALYRAKQAGRGRFEVFAANRLRESDTQVQRPARQLGYEGQGAYLSRREGGIL